MKKKKKNICSHRVHGLHDIYLNEEKSGWVKVNRSWGYIQNLQLVLWRDRTLILEVKETMIRIQAASVCVLAMLYSGYKFKSHKRWVKEGCSYINLFLCKKKVSLIDICWMTSWGLMEGVYLSLSLRQSCVYFCY